MIRLVNELLMADDKGKLRRQTIADDKQIRSGIVIRKDWYKVEPTISDLTTALDFLNEYDAVIEDLLVENPEHEYKLIGDHNIDVLYREASEIMGLDYEPDHAALLDWHHWALSIVEEEIARATNGPRLNPYSFDILSYEYAKEFLDAMRDVRSREHKFLMLNKEKKSEFDRGLDRVEYSYSMGLPLTAFDKMYTQSVNLLAREFKML